MTIPGFTVGIRFSCYQEIYLVAWSIDCLGGGTGVAKSESCHPPKAVAINGTPKPNDDQFGIPSAIFQGTLDHLNATTRNKFEHQNVPKQKKCWRNIGSCRIIVR